MSEAVPTSCFKGDLEGMRRVAVEWLRKEGRDTASGDNTLVSEPEPNSEAVVLIFLLRASAAGFACEIVEANESEGAGYVARWTHQGASFVGFKQPPPQETPEFALLSGCAALLENDWCRSRL